MMFVFNNEKFASYEEMKPVAVSYLIDNFADFDTNIHDIEAEVLENVDSLLSAHFPVSKNMLKQIQTKDFNSLPFGGHVIEVNSNNY